MTKRGKSAIGIGRGNALADFVHPNLSEEASNVCASIDIFGASIEKVLMRWVVLFIIPCDTPTLGTFSTL